MPETTTAATESDAAEDTEPAAKDTAQDTTEPDAAAGTEDSNEDQADDHGDSREAAKYRRRLRETETERDSLREQLEQLQRAEVERVAGDVLHRPAGLWANGTELAGLLGEDGRVDPELVRTAATAARDTLGLQPRKQGLHVPGEGRSPEVSQSSSGRDGMVKTVMGMK